MIVRGLGIRPPAEPRMPTVDALNYTAFAPRFITATTDRTGVKDYRLVGDLGRFSVELEHLTRTPPWTYVHVTGKLTGSSVSAGPLPPRQRLELAAAIDAFVSTSQVKAKEVPLYLELSRLLKAP